MGPGEMISPGALHPPRLTRTGGPLAKVKQASLLPEKNFYAESARSTSRLASAHRNSAMEMMIPPLAETLNLDSSDGASFRTTAASKASTPSSQLAERMA